MIVETIVDGNITTESPIISLDPEYQKKQAGKKYNISQWISIIFLIILCCFGLWHGDNLQHDVRSSSAPISNTPNQYFETYSTRDHQSSSFSSSKKFTPIDKKVDHNKSYQDDIKKNTTDTTPQDTLEFNQDEQLSTNNTNTELVIYGNQSNQHAGDQSLAIVPRRNQLKHYVYDVCVEVPMFIENMFMNMDDYILCIILCCISTLCQHSLHSRANAVDFISQTGIAIIDTDKMVKLCNNHIESIIIYMLSIMPTSNTLYELIHYNSYQFATLCKCLLGFSCCLLSIPLQYLVSDFMRCIMFMSTILLTMHWLYIMIFMPKNTQSLSIAPSEKIAKKYKSTILKIAKKHKRKALSIIIIMTMFMTTPSCYPRINYDQKNYNMITEKFVVYDNTSLHTALTNLSIDHILYQRFTTSFKDYNKLTHTILSKNNTQLAVYNGILNQHYSAQLTHKSYIDYQQLPLASCNNYPVINDIYRRNKPQQLLPKTQTNTQLAVYSDQYQLQLICPARKQPLSNNRQLFIYQPKLQSYITNLQYKHYIIRYMCEYIQDMQYYKDTHHNEFAIYRTIEDQDTTTIIDDNTDIQQIDVNASNGYYVS